MKDKWSDPLKLDDDAFTAVGDEVVAFLAEYMKRCAADPHVAVSVLELKQIFKACCPSCVGTTLTVFGDHQLDIYATERVFSLVFTPPMDCTFSVSPENGFDVQTKLHETLGENHYIILASTPTTISLSRIMDNLRIFYHISLLASTKLTDATYSAGMVATLSKWYQSTPHALELYCLLCRMAFRTCKIHYHGLQDSNMSDISSVSDRLLRSSSILSGPLPDELFSIQRHLHTLIFYFSKFSTYAQSRLRTTDKSQGLALLTLLASLAKMLFRLQKDEKDRPFCIVTDWKTCSLVKGSAAVGLGVPQTDGLYFADYGCRGLVPYNDRGGHFLAFTIHLQDSVMRLFTKLKVSFQPQRRYISILIGRWGPSTRSFSDTKLIRVSDIQSDSNSKTPSNLSFSALVSSASTNTTVNSVQSTPTQNHSDTPTPTSKRTLLP